MYSNDIKTVSLPLNFRKNDHLNFGKLLVENQSSKPKQTRMILFSFIIERYNFVFYVSSTDFNKSKKAIASLMGVVFDH